MSARRPDSLDDLRVGDEVALITFRSWSADDIQRRPVERVTKTQVIIGPWRFRKNDGREVGKSSYGRSRVELYDPAKHDPMFAALEDERERNITMGRIRDQNLRHLSTDQLRRIVAILDEEPPE